MGRRVKLFDKVGEFSDSDIAFKAPTGKYFSSEKAYKIWENNKNYREKCINKVFELLGYESYQKLPSLFYKRLSEWTGYGFETVYRAIGRAEQNICWVLTTKDFSSEVGKLMYITKIIEGQLNDAKREVLAKNKIVSKENRSVDNFDGEVITTSEKIMKGTDIRSLFGDDNWI